MSASNMPSFPRPPAAPVQQGVRPSAAPAQGTRASAAAVAGAIRKASQSTGASFEYLLATAKVESDLNPNLTMQSSTATGLFQFLEQTWLGVMQSAGCAFRFWRHGAALTPAQNGTHVVEEP